MTLNSSQCHYPIHSSSSNKYVGEDGKVRTLIVKRHPFKGIENYFTDSLLNQDSLEVDENPHLEEPDSCNEADTEPKED